jgi:hypothetical protein
VLCWNLKEPCQPAAETLQWTRSHQRRKWVTQITSRCYLMYAFILFGQITSPVGFLFDDQQSLLWSKLQRRVMYRAQRESFLTGRSQSRLRKMYKAQRESFIMGRSQCRLRVTQLIRVYIALFDVCIWLVK